MTKATDLELTPTGLLNRDTGQMLDANSPDADLVAGLAWIRQAESQLASLKREWGDILTARMDKRSEWTVRSGGVKVSAPSPAAAAYEWDPVRLRGVLKKLVDAGKIGPEAAERCWGKPKDPPPAVRGINAVLATLGKRDQASVNACKVPKAQPRRTVSVS